MKLSLAGLWRQAIHPLGPVGSQAIAQACTLAAQLALIRLIGADAFATIGLALMALSSVCFIGELGYGPYFLREAASGTDWQRQWRQAAGQRLIVLGAAALVAALALRWSAPDPVPALTMLTAALPGVVLCAFVPTPLLFAQGRVRAASGAVVLRFAVQAVLLVGAATWAPATLPAWAGVAFTAGVAAQIAMGLACGIPLACLRPTFSGLAPARPALRLWGLSLVGTLNDRALPFVVGAAAPDLLAATLILVQVLQGASGVLTQIDRLLVPALARTKEAVTATPAVKGVVLPVLAAALAAALAVTALAAQWRPDAALAAALLMTEWVAVLAGALAFAPAFACRRERPVARFMLAALPVSVAAQIGLAHAVALEPLLALRAVIAATAAVLALACLRPQAEAVP